MLYNCEIKMASHEWSASTSMEKIAREWFDSLPPEAKRFSVCTVHEHAGWWLSYGFVSDEFKVVHSANDRAFWDQSIVLWWKIRNSLKRDGIKDHPVFITRPEAQKIEAPAVLA